MYRDQNEILQENMRSTAFFKLYKICILLHRCNLKILAKKRSEKSASQFFSYIGPSGFCGLKITAAGKRMRGNATSNPRPSPSWALVREVVARRRLINEPRRRNQSNSKGKAWEQLRRSLSAARAKLQSGLRTTWTRRMQSYMLRHE